MTTHFKIHCKNDFLSQLIFNWIKKKNQKPLTVRATNDRLTLSYSCYRTSLHRIVSAQLPIDSPIFWYHRVISATVHYKFVPLTVFLEVFLSLFPTAINCTWISWIILLATKSRSVKLLPSWCVHWVPTIGFSFLLLTIPNLLDALTDFESFAQSYCSIHLSNLYCSIDIFGNKKLNFKERARDIVWRKSVLNVNLFTFNSRCACGPFEIASNRSWSWTFSFFSISINRSRFTAAFRFSERNVLDVFSSFRSCNFCEEYEKPWDYLKIIATNDLLWWKHHLIDKPIEWIHLLEPFSWTVFS